MYELPSTIALSVFVQLSIIGSLIVASLILPPFPTIPPAPSPDEPLTVPLFTQFFIVLKLLPAIPPTLIRLFSTFALFTQLSIIPSFLPTIPPVGLTILFIIVPDIIIFFTSPKVLSIFSSAIV